MTIAPFGWANNGAPYISAANLEAMLSQAGAYTDAETTRATAAEALKAPLASPALTGSPTAPTPTAGDNDTSIATTAFVTAADAATTPLDQIRMNAWGVLSEPYPMAVAINSQILTSGRMESALIGLQAGMVLTGIVVDCTVLGATLTGVYACLYSATGGSGGTLMTTSPQNQNTTSPLTTTINTAIQLPFFSSGTYTVPTTGAYYATLLVTTSSGTMPTLARMQSSGPTNGVNGGVSLFSFNTSLSTPPSSMTGVKENNAYYIAVY